MSHLLHLVRFAPKALQRKGAIPLLMEFPVNPETAPFLVTSTESLKWTTEAFPGDIVRAAVRQKTTKEVIFREVFESIALMGKEVEWGNAHPFTEAGFMAAMDHVLGYDLAELELLAPKVREKDHKLGKYRRPKWMESLSLPPRPTSWLPDDGAVIVPKDREYLGFIGLVGTGIVAVVHNAARGIGVIRGS